MDCEVVVRGGQLAWRNCGVLPFVAMGGYCLVLALFVLAFFIARKEYLESKELEAWKL